MMNDYHNPIYFVILYHFVSEYEKNIINKCIMYFLKPQIFDWQKKFVKEVQPKNISETASKFKFSWQWISCIANPFSCS